MTGDSMYILRYPLVPEEPKQKRIDLLLQFCDGAKIDEVMFLVMPEECNRGQWRPSDYEPWMEMALKAKTIVERQGLKTSLNLWHTILHCDRGRKSEDLNYRRMVLDTGHECLSVACPLCSDWQTIFFDTFQRWAKAGFKAIWLEDDFRFHNHSSRGWGGCFCDEHIKVLSHSGAQARNREELVAHLNAAGVVHPDRKVWLDLNARTYIDLAQKMRATMDAVDPAIKLGLMTSGVQQHTLEGRNWSGLITALGGPERTMVRPNACGYSENCRTSFFEGFGNLSETLGVLPRGAKTFFELENCPMSRFAKSHQQTTMQMASVIDGACDGITLDVLDFLGTGPACEPEMAPTLAGAKDKLLDIRERVKGKSPVGIQAILPVDTTYLAPGVGKGIPDLPTIGYGWFVYLGGFGYPCINRPQIDKIDPENIFALAGASVWAIQEDRLKSMLQTSVVLLDAVAAAIVVQRGLGELIGVQKIQRYARDTSTYSYEENADCTPTQIPQRTSVNRMSDKGFIHTYDLTSAGRSRTVIKDCFNRTMGTGSFTYTNNTGGRGLVLPYQLPAEDTPHNWTRKHWLDGWLADLSGGGGVPHLVNGSWVYISARSGASGKTIFLANQTFEIYQRLELELPEDFARMNWTMDLHGRDKAGVVKVQSNRMTVETELVGNDWLMLTGR